LLYACRGEGSAGISKNIFGRGKLLWDLQIISWPGGYHAFYAKITLAFGRFY